MRGSCVRGQGRRMRVCSAAVSGRRPPLPYHQQLVTVAAALCLVAVLLSAMIVSGYLPWIRPDVRATECHSPQDNPDFDSSLYKVIPHPMKPYMLWRSCVATLYDKWRNSRLGIPPASLRPHVFLVVIIQLPSYRQALHYFTNAVQYLCELTFMVQLLGGDNLDILHLLFLLLVVAGDVERNPGPLKTAAEQVFDSVTDEKLTEHDVHDVNVEVFSLAGNWRKLATGLKIPLNLVRMIASNNSNDCEQCLLTLLEEWLKQSYDVKRYGHPSWRALVRAVASSPGGGNPALAQTIADKHPVVSKDGGMSVTQLPTASPETQIYFFMEGSTSAQREYVVDPNNNCDDFSELKEFLKKNYLISKETNSVHENANAWEYLGKAITINKTLQTSSPNLNEIGAEGGVDLGETLTVNQTLQTLSPNLNEIGAEGGVAPGEAADTINRTLQTLSPNLNEIGAEGGVAPGEAAVTINQTLQTLSLNGNEIGAEGGVAPREVVTINQTLQTSRTVSNVECSQKEVVVGTLPSTEEQSSSDHQHQMENEEEETKEELITHEEKETPFRPPSKKQKDGIKRKSKSRGDEVDLERLWLIKDFDKPAEPEDQYGLSVAEQLRSMPQKQRALAKQKIQEVLFQVQYCM